MHGIIPPLALGIHLQGLLLAPQHLSRQSRGECVRLRDMRRHQPALLPAVPKPPILPK